VGIEGAKVLIVSKRSSRFEQRFNTANSDEFAGKLSNNSENCCDSDKMNWLAMIFELMANSKMYEYESLDIVKPFTVTIFFIMLKNAADACLKIVGEASTFGYSSSTASEFA
ncbi:MAG: hypothetical protein ACK559_32640, partial [bacterium]